MQNTLPMTRLARLLGCGVVFAILCLPVVVMAKGSTYNEVGNTGQPCASQAQSAMDTCGEWKPDKVYSVGQQRIEIVSYPTYYGMLCPLSYQLMLKSADKAPASYAGFDITNHSLRLDSSVRTHDASLDMWNPIWAPCPRAGKVMWGAYHPLNVTVSLEDPTVPVTIHFEGAVDDFSLAYDLSAFMIHLLFEASREFDASLNTAALLDDEPTMAKLTMLGADMLDVVVKLALTGEYDQLFAALESSQKVYGEMIADVYRDTENMQACQAIELALSSTAVSNDISVNMLTYLNKRLMDYFRHIDERDSITWTYTP